MILCPLESFAQPKDLIFEYLPLYPGSTWTYESTTGKSESKTDVITVTGVRSINEISVVSSDSTLSGGNDWVFLRNKAYRFKSLVKNGTKIAYTGGILMLDLPLIVGTIWGSNFDKSGTTYVEIISREDVQTKAGKFKDAMKLGIKNSQSPNYNAFIWLAKGVGIVKTLETELSSTLTSYDLASPAPKAINPVAPDLFLRNLVPLEEAKDLDPGVPELRPESTRSKLLVTLSTPTGIFTAAGLIILFLFIVILAKVSSFLKVEVDSLNLEAKKNLADTYLKTGDFQKAEKVLLRFVKKNPSFPDALNTLGKTYMGMEKYQKASECFEKALKINPDYFEAMVNLSRSLLASDRIDETIKILQGLIQKYPDYPDLRYLISEAFIQKNEHNKAMEHISIAIEINPDYDRAKKLKQKITILTKGEPNE